MSLMAAPTVGVDAVIAVSNDMSVQALQRDPASGTGGLWPTGWNPIGLGNIAHHRRRWCLWPAARWPSSRPRTVGSTPSTPLTDPEMVDTPPRGGGQGAPAGIFTAFGGAYDYVLVGRARPAATAFTRSTPTPAR